MPAQVSVVIATHNHAAYLANALDSVFRQGVPNIELIVVDDGSTDNTAEVMHPYLNDPRVQYVTIAHGGVARARNIGLKSSVAPLVAFLDADDQWLPGKLGKQLALLASDPEVAVVYSRRQVVDGSGSIVPSPSRKLHRGNVLGELFRDNFVCFSSALVQRKAFDTVGPFDESLALSSDYEMWLRIASRFRFDFVDEVLVSYRSGHPSLSRRVEERYLTAMAIMKRFLEDCGGNEMLSPAIVKLAWAETYTHLGWIRRGRSRAAALLCYLKALGVSMGYLPAWKALLVLLLPARFREWVRRLLRNDGWVCRRIPKMQFLYRA
jgi:glycosyltransferase involved in cell wall biosynthesis